MEFLWFVKNVIQTFDSANFKITECNIFVKDIPVGFEICVEHV